MSAVYHLPEPSTSQAEPTSAEWLARDEAALAGVLPRITDVVAVRGEGAWLCDADGRRYLDFGSGIAVTNTGHCHPQVVAAITAQAATLIHTSVVAHHDRGSIRLAERLAGLVPVLRRAPGVLLQLRRRGGRRIAEAGPQGRPASPGSSPSGGPSTAAPWPPPA